MSNEKREPDFIETRINEYAGRRTERVTKMYGSTVEIVNYDHGQTTLCLLEAKIAKDGELIQKLVDTLHGLCYGPISMEDAADVAIDILEDAAAQGFTTADPK